MSFKPTEEQSPILELAKQGKDVVINAYAGTGKTATCVLIAEAVVKPSLYLAFNKKMAEEAKRRMPPHVECRTWHSIAFQEVGLDYQHKMTRPRGAYRNLSGTGGEIGRYFKIPPMELSEGRGFVGSTMFGIAVKKTLTRFEYSDNRNIGKKHIDHSVLKKYNGAVLKEDLQKFDDTVLHYAKKLWNLRADMDSPVLITHDTYLKMFQLNNPIIEGYEVIYADEHQDTTLTMNAILTLQKAQKIVVGDNFQKIYGWRGSVDGMSISGGKKMTLSKSFRFGEEVADVANSIIGVGRVRGCDVHTKVYTEHPESYKGKTLLFRTNAALLSSLVELLSKGYAVNIEANTDEFRRLLESCLFLKNKEKRKVKHEDILPYDDWEELKMSIKNGVVGGDISIVCRLIETGEYLSVLGAMDRISATKDADVLLTTAHKAKGREWKEVVVMNDFPDHTKEGINQEERNLYYVACTRATNSLYYTPM